jgi:hypothetical protein
VGEDGLSKKEKGKGNKEMRKERKGEFGINRKKGRRK